MEALRGSLSDGYNDYPAETIAPIGVLVVDDHPLIRAGARAMLSDPAIKVVAEATSGTQAVRLAGQLRPDVVLMDVNMPDMDGVTATAEIKREAPGTSVIIVTGDERREHIRRAIEAGAAGYLMKGAPRHVLIQAVKLVQAGGSLIDASMLSALAKDAEAESGDAGRTEVSRRIASLSPRELEALRYLSAGMTNKEIAGRMHYSVGTVKNVVQRIIEKLGVSDRTQAAVYAVRAGLDLE